MSDYGLLSRNLAINLRYEDTPYSLADAKIPVFVVGREQLYEMFGFFGREKSNFHNRCSVCFGDPSKASYAVLISGARPFFYPRGVFFWDVYQSIEDCASVIENCLEVDAEEQLEHPGIAVHIYEIWQICDDYSLYAAWDRESERYMCDSGQKHKFSQAWRFSYEDNADYEAEFGPRIMSEDYLSSLKTANASGVEHCYYCGLPLSRPYMHAMEVNGTVELVCGSCLLAHSDQLSENPDLGEYFVCDRCGKRLSVEHLSHTVSGVYCRACKSVLCIGLWSCSDPGYSCDPGTFPDPICHGCEFCNTLCNSEVC